MQRSAFDEYAAAYDRHFSHSPIGHLQRMQVYRHLNKYLDKEKNVLELNCGTGEDAIYLSSRVKHIVATDISAGMIETLRQKKPPTNVEAVVLDMRRLSQHYYKPEFDLVFSDFGGLNCLSGDELSVLSGNLSQILKTGGYFIAVVMSRSCAWHTFLHRNKPKAGAGRSEGGPVALQVQGAPANTFYYNPKEFAGLFANDFALIKTRPIGLFVPPSYLNDVFVPGDPRLKLLSGLDQAAGGIGFLSRFADHFMVVLKKS